MTASLISQCIWGIQHKAKLLEMNWLENMTAPLNNPLGRSSRWHTSKVVGTQSGRNSGRTRWNGKKIYFADLVRERGAGVTPKYINLFWGVGWLHPSRAKFMEQLVWFDPFYSNFKVKYHLSEMQMPVNTFRRSECLVKESKVLYGWKRLVCLKQLPEGHWDPLVQVAWVGENQ